MTLPEPERPALEPRTADSIESAVDAFGLLLVGEPAAIADSVLNENFRVETDAGSRFLRFIRKKRPVERVLVEHRAMLFAASQGVPVRLPELSGEAPFVRAGGHLVQLYPWVDGRQAAATEADAFAVGQMEATIHLALAGFHDDDLAMERKGIAWDTDDAIQALSRIDDLIRYYPAPSPQNLRIQQTLRFQLELLESDQARRPSEFTVLPVQTCHGDYHNRNVLLRDPADVAAVVDWEIVGTISPVFELLRALSFSGYLDPPLLDAYLRGYGSRRRLTALECELGVEQWWQSRLHNTWTYRMRFIEGDRRVDRFFDEEADLLRRFSDPAYRTWLSSELRRLATT